jgi:hypothetical protein
MNKDELQDVFFNLEENSEKLAQKFQAGLKTCMYTKDTARHLRTLLEIEDDLCISWEDVGASALSLSKEYGGYILNDSFPGSLSASTAGSIVATCDSGIYRATTSKPALPQSVITAIKPFQSFACSNVNEKIIRELMISYNLESRYPDNKSPIELLDTALDIFHKPATTEVAPSSSLIPLRECIDEMIEYFNNHTLKPEKAKSKDIKVTSILNQSKFHNIDNAQILLIANEAKLLLSDLSDIKRKNINRERWEQLINRGLMFIQNFVSSIDKTNILS